jgi:hypothetical protein
MKTITGKDVKLLPEMIYEAILEHDGEKGFLRDHVFFSKDSIPEDAKKLYTYFDMSTPLFMEQCPNILKYIAKSISENLYEDMRYLDYENRRENRYPTIMYHNWNYTFYDNADIKMEYHREKNKFSGEEIDYVRLFFSLTAKINKND